MTDLAMDTLDRIAALEAAMLPEEQVDCPVTHHFGPGVYIREVAIPAQTLVIGHAHKGPCMNMLLKGSMRVMGPDGVAKTIEAPLIFNTGPGRKVAFTLSDCVFQNIHATDETDLDRLEEQLIDKSAEWLAHQQEQAMRLIEGEA